MSNTFLFSIDLEEPKLFVNGTLTVLHRLPLLIDPLLLFLKEQKMQSTFFVVGELIPLYPDIIKKVRDEGHELAYHTYSHTPLDQFTPELFELDLEKGQEAFKKVGVDNVHGFRAPILSLTDKTKWVYPLLKKWGFHYSSSVLPATNPLYGWPEFGHQIKKIEGIWELPVSLGQRPLMLPFASGTYFRVLPQLILKQFFNHYRKEEKDIIGYFHPYDFDHLCPRYMHDGIKESRFFNFLIYYNRKKLYTKMSSLQKQFPFRVQKYSDYLHLKGIRA